jgi:hypothetical protein
MSRRSFEQLGGCMIWLDSRFDQGILSYGVDMPLSERTVQHSCDLEDEEI